MARRLLRLTLAVLLAVAFLPGDASGQSPASEGLIEWQRGTGRDPATVEDGVIRIAGRPWVRSNRAFNDLLLRLEFRLMTRETTGALLVRAWTDRSNGLARTGYRIALRGHDSKEEVLGQIEGLSERVHASMAPVPLSLTLGEWHMLDVYCVDDEVRVTINGHLVHAVTGSERAAGLLVLDVRTGAIDMRSARHTPVRVELPEGLTWTSELPDHGVEARVLGNRVSPRYTADAKARGVQGEVILDGVIGIDGRLLTARVVQTLGSELDAEAIAAVGRWRFAPATVDGKPVPSVARFVIGFQLH